MQFKDIGADVNNPPHTQRLMNAYSLAALLLIGNAAQPLLAAEAETDAETEELAVETADKSSSKSKKSDKALDENLDEVVVSATKTATEVSNAPAAVTVIGGKHMESKNISRLGDALTNVPSLYLGFPALGQTQGSSGSGGFSLRGANTQRTLVLVDGQPLQDSNSSTVDWRTVMTDDIEKVEVVPGAFSSLYGSSAMGGVINVITKRASKHELTVRGKKGFQDAEGEDGSIYLRERFDNGLGITAGFSYQDRDGYMNEYNVRTLTTGAVNTPVTGAIPTTTTRGSRYPAYIVGEKGRSPWTQMNATAKLDYDFSNGDRLRAGWSFSDYQMGYTPLTSYLRDGAGHTVTSGTNLGVDGHRLNLSESTFVTSAPLNSATNRYFAGYEHYFSDDVVWKSNVAFIDREYSFSTVDSGSTQYKGTGLLTDAPNNGLDIDTHLNFPLRFSGMPFAKDHVFVTGANLHRETVDRGAFYLSNWREPDTVTGQRNGYTGDSKIYSLYAQDEISVFDPLTVYLGGRMNWWETEGDFVQYNDPPTAAKYKQHGVTNFTPKFSAVYRPVDEFTFRTSWGTAFRAPANADMYSTSKISSSTSSTGFLITKGDPNIKPETATTWEAGGEWRISPKVKMGSTYYENVIDDMIYSKTNEERSETLRINAGKARIRGVEFSFGAKPLDWLELFSNYGYVDSRMLSNPADPTSVGKRLTTVPKHAIKAGFIANYQDWSGSMEMNHFSHQYVQSSNSDVTDNVPGSPSQYTILNAKLGYKINDMIKLNTAVNNLTDEKFYQFYLMPGINLTTEIVLSF